VFVAFGAIVLMTTFLKEAGIVVVPIHVAMWGIPTAVSAFIVHGFRLWLLDRKLERELRGNAAGAASVQTQASTSSPTQSKAQRATGDEA
jgi:uncharacterized membrane protein